MKHILLISAMALATLTGFAQPHYYQARKSISAAAGYSKIHMNCDDFQTAFLEATYYSNPQLGWEFSTRVEYGGNDYLSFEPVTLLALPTWIYSSTHGASSEAKMIFAFLSISSAKLPIALDDDGFFEITPYWSLLKLTRLYDENFRVNGDLGIQFKLFPIALFRWYNTLYISGFAQWNWGYKKSDNYYGRYAVKENRSDFYGYAYGLSIGMYF